MSEEIVTDGRRFRVVERGAELGRHWCRVEEVKEPPEVVAKRRAYYQRLTARIKASVEAQRKADVEKTV